MRSFFSFKRKKKASISSERPWPAMSPSRTEEQQFQKNMASAGYYPSRTRTSGGDKWSYGLSSSGSSVYLNHTLLRRNARSAYHDTPQARALVDRFADTVADIGLFLEPAPKAGILGLSQENAEAWASDVEERFDTWAQSKSQHRAEQITFYQSHRMYQIFQQRDNDIFVRLYYSPDNGLLNPLQFDFVDPEMVRGDAITSTTNISPTSDGIIRDDRGRETAYKIWVYDSVNNKYNEVDIPAYGPKSGRLFMLHGFAAEYAGQKRGYSRLAHALQEFENLTDFTQAQIKKAINQSNLVFMMQNDQADPGNPFEGILTNNGAGPASQQFGSSPVPDLSAQNVIAESTQPVNYMPLPEATLGTPGSVGIFNATQGDKLVPVENTAPSSSFDIFVDAFTSYLCSANGMPLEVLLMKFNQNYSASRAALILFWRICQMWRNEMASDYLNPVYEMWMCGEIAAGRIYAPGWSDPRLRAAWLNCRWIGSPMPNIDPMRTASADKMYVEMGAQTLDRVARNFNGSSGAANRAKLRREYAELPQSPFNNNSRGG